MPKQLALKGIGQQKVTLTDWKKENNIFTHHAPHMDEHIQWSCWDEYRDPADFLGEYGGDSFGHGKTEKEAIINFCTDNQIKLPFWW